MAPGGVRREGERQEVWECVMWDRWGHAGRRGINGYLVSAVVRKRQEGTRKESSKSSGQCDTLGWACVRMSIGWCVLMGVSC